jgi:hypothetical protein
MNILIPNKTNPVLVDAVVQDIQQALGSVPWLNNIFGRAHRVERDGKFIPTVHNGWGEYTPVIPSDSMGNYSYIEMGDPLEVEEHKGAPGIRGTASLIVWLDTTTHPVEDGGGALNFDEATRDIIEVLKSGKLKNCRIFVKNIYNKPENIFKGYDMRQITQNYLVYPWGGFRIEFEFYYTKVC